MDRLLFGDNQFFGVNHMSEEKARSQQMRFQDLGAIMEVLDAAYDEGVTTFMCTTHDRVAEICDIVRADQDRYARMEFFPCMPYAHKYANAMTEDGPLGALRRFLPDQSVFSAALTGTKSLASKDIDGITRLLIDAEMSMFRGLRTPVVFLQNVVVDLLLGLGFDEAFVIFADHVRKQYDAEPGFITMNLPRLLDTLERLGIDNPIVCSNINKIGFRMPGGLEAYETRPARPSLPGDRHVGLRLGRDPARGGHRLGVRAAEHRVHRLRRLQPTQHRVDQGPGRQELGAGLPVRSTFRMSGWTPFGPQNGTTMTHQHSSRRRRRREWKEWPPMTLRAYFQILLKRWRIVVACTVLVLGAAGTLTYLTPPTYAAHATAFVSISSTGGADASIYASSQFAMQRVASYTEVVKSPDTLQPVIDKLGLKMSVRDLRAVVSADNPPTRCSSR